MFIEIKAIDTIENNKDTYFLNVMQIVSVEKEHSNSIIKMVNGDVYRTEDTYLDIKGLIKEALNRRQQDIIVERKLMNEDIISSMTQNIVANIKPPERLRCGLSPFIHRVKKELSIFNDNCAYIINMTFAEDENMDNVMKPLTYDFLSYIGFDIEQELRSMRYSLSGVNKELEYLTDTKFPTKESLLYWIERVMNSQSDIVEDDVPSILDKCDNKEPVSQEFLSMIQ